MKIVKYFSLIVLPALLLAACSNPSALNEKSSDVDHTVSSQPGKTIIVDVRTAQEWNNDGHADCTVNYPLNELTTKIETLKGFDKVILVCLSGIRAGQAKELLEEAGIKNVENKGAWQNIGCK